MKQDVDLPARAHAVALRSQAELLIIGCERAAMFDADLERLRAVAERLGLTGPRPVG